MTRRTRRPSPQTVALLDQLARHGTGWAHGYDLCRTLGIKAGTVYPILIRLSERGLLETVWEQVPRPGRPPRHLYRLSSAGWAFLAQVRVDRAAEDEAGGRPTVRPVGA
ncbi:MAG: PadR family transcriptional regulator [Actinobacteria bacterium]|nr:PadR family transcriptional regulator [Actinomycetota bacterium]